MLKSNLSLEERLSAHPKLQSHVLALLEIAESNIDKADEAEERTMAEVRGLGRQILEEWARHREQSHAQALEASPEACRHGKKTPLADDIRRDCP